MMFSIYIIIIYMVMLALRPVRRLAIALLPWVLFGCSYDVMRLYPNYLVNDIDVRGIYEAEKQLFGIASEDGVRMILSEYFAACHCVLADVLAGVFYLCWVPVPMAFALYLYFSHDYRSYLRFSFAFLLVNWLGFCGYYLHPAAAPWYVMQYGFEPMLHTPGNMAGLARFDELTGVPVFHVIYGQNANVFAAVPSLHAAYMLVATAYAVISRRGMAVTLVFAVICTGIWVAAVYTGHHYVIDVLLGIATAILGMLLCEGVIRTTVGRKVLDSYVRGISDGGARRII